MNNDLIARLRGGPYVYDGPTTHETMIEAADEIERLRENAARYRWLRANARCISEHWGGRWSLVLDGPAPTRDDDECAVDAAIDAAMAKLMGGER